MNVSPKKLLLIPILFVGTIFVFSKIQGCYIDENYIYVLGKLDSVNDSGDSKNFKFSYFYRGRRYQGGISALEFLSQDSLVLLRISVNNPSIIEIRDEKIPDCFVDDKYLGAEWKEFPKCK